MSLTVGAAKAKFESLDSNKNGRLEFEDVVKFLRQGDATISDNDCRLLFTSIDKSGEGWITMNEFIDFVCDFAEGWQELERIESPTAKNKQAGGWIDVSKCEELLSTTTKFLLAVDGSEVSTVARDYVADDLLWKNRNTHADIVHVYCESKDYLPPKLRSAAVKEAVETKFAGSVSSKRYSLSWISKNGRPAAEHLVSEATRSSSDFIIMGYTGLKGKKDRRIVSSNCYEVLKASPCSVIVIKDEAVEHMPMKRPTKFVVSVSLNKASTKAFLDALRLSQPEDEVHVVYCIGRLDKDQNIYEHELRAKYENFFGSIANGSDAFTKFQDRQCHFHVIKQPAQKTVPQAIVEHADSLGADFIVVGTKALRVARGKEPVGSISMQICMETERNFIVSNWAS